MGLSMADRKPLSDIMPMGNSKEDLIVKIRSLFLVEYKKHHDLAVMTMCEALDVESLENVYEALKEHT